MMPSTEKIVVLNVDDYEAGRYATSRVLRQAGFDVDEAASGEDALRKVKDAPDLVVLDVNLPDVNGFEVCRRIKSDPETASIPVLYLSAAYRGAEHRVQGLDLGADGYLTQPVEPRELVATVNALLRARHVRAAVEHSEERFRSLMTATTDIIWTTDAQGNFVSEQPDWSEFTGQSREEVLGDGWQAAIHPDDRERLMREWEAAVASPAFFETEARVRRRDGYHRHMSVRAVPVTEDDGSVREWVGANTDITERVEAQEEREKLIQQLEAANRSKSDFLATMSHELRTPLNAMIGYTDLMMMGIPQPLQEGSRIQVDRIRSAATHLSLLIEEILTHARIDAGHDVLHRTRVDVGAVIGDVVAFMEPLSEQKGLRFTLRQESVPQYIVSDPRKLRQVLLNLLGNAVKFTDEGEVSLTVGREADSLRLEVRDTGLGIAPGDLERIFEPFWQVDGSRTRLAGGTGLGLAVVRQLVSHLGGTIRVESTPGEGSTFVVTLPVEPSEE